MASSYIVTWHYPILQYSFPDEESFKVDIVHETGFWFWPGQKVTQIFELNGVNVHQSMCFSYIPTFGQTNSVMGSVELKCKFSIIHNCD